MPVVLSQHPAVKKSWVSNPAYLAAAALAFVIIFFVAYLLIPVSTYIDVGQLAGQGPDTIRAILGEPDQITSVPEYSEWKPGEFWEYKTPEFFSFQILMYQGRAIHFIANMSKPEGTELHALQRLGINLTGVRRSDAWENVTAGGVHYHRITVACMDGCGDIGVYVER